MITDTHQLILKMSGLEDVQIMWDVVFAYWLVMPFYLMLKNDYPHLFNFEQKFGKYGFLITLTLIAIILIHIKLMTSAFW